MYVFGGNAFVHDANLQCQSAELLVLDLSCEAWTPDVRLLDTGVARRQFASSVMTGAAEMLVLGGYNGVVLRDTVTYRLETDFCDLHTERVRCLADSRCGWSGNTTECVNAQTAPPELTALPLWETSALCEARVCGALTSYKSVDRCGVCVSQTGCGYCPLQAPGERCQNASLTCSDSTGEDFANVLAPNSLTCGQCSYQSSCSDCTQTGCVWDLTRRVCGLPSSSGGANEVSDPAGCPAPCSNFTDCSSCTANRLSCFWCESAQACLVRSSYTTEFSLGQCFRMEGEMDVCPTRCEDNVNCEECLAEPRCGWCGENGGTGEGNGTAGTAAGPGLFEPGVGQCADPLLADNFSWAYIDCPDIDQCAIGTDLCGVNSTCVNEDDRESTASSRGYRCTCPARYRLDEAGLNCLPVCDTYGCAPETGLCVAPDVCECALGYFGLNCTGDCGCNGHSKCESGGPGTCDQCEENTTGPRCELCLPGFHGNATERGSCLPCEVVCNGHSTECNQNVTAEDEPVCQNCQDNTSGSYCEPCSSGFFLSPDLLLLAFGNGTSARALIDARLANSSCVPCFCNGHSSICDPDTGENCVCSDNTITKGSQCNASFGTCWAQQCASCSTSAVIGTQVLSQAGEPSKF